MAHTLLIHMENEEPFVAEVEELPQPADQIVICNNPRRRDGKDVGSFLPEAVTVVIPVARLLFLEVLPTEVPEELVTFVRE
jgi:hypothetical protein